MKVGILTTKTSWFMKYRDSIVEALAGSCDVYTYEDHNDIAESLDVLWILNYFRIIPLEKLNQHKYNMVIHASELPKGKGWAPMTWQILEGKNNIPVSMIDAVEGVDAGPIYGRDCIELDGSELIEEVRQKLVQVYKRMITNFLELYPNVSCEMQSGNESFYERRRPENSELDINKTIAEQMNLLRVVDNEDYPAFFYYKGNKYILQIMKEEE